MATLKISYDEILDLGKDVPAAFTQRDFWITDVTSIDKLDKSLYSAWADVNERHGDGVRTFAQLDVPLAAPSNAFREVTLTLLLVTFRGESDYRLFLVQKAWLLASDGSTIDRIAP